MRPRKIKTQKIPPTESQLIDQTIQTTLTNQFRPYCLISGMLFAVALLEWFRWYKNLPPVPYIMSVLFLISTIIAYFKQKQFSQELGFLNFGKKGEKPVSEYIHEISVSNNFRVFKDISIGNHECDYILCAKFGIVIIEIVELPLPQSDNAIVEYKNKKLTFNGYPMDRDPVKELDSLSQIFKKILYKSAHKEFNVYSVVAIPNWFVKESKNSDVKLINPRQLPELFTVWDEEIMLDDDQSMASYHVNKFLRVNPGI